jgi:serine phosphatase RsbU (regulator of sigma subunit)
LLICNQNTKMIVITESQEVHKEELNNAQVIQQGMLPKKRHFERLFKDSFTLYIPQNIISGDFYWVGEKHNMQYLVVGDCTGHGVSAALLSILAINLFEYTIMNKGYKKTSKILKEVDKKFIESFKGSQHGTFDNPWIDLSIVCIDQKAKQMTFSSGNRKLMHIDKSNQMNIYKGSRYPIGGWQLEKNRTFDSQTIDYSNGDTIYLGSDGFQDQIGGPSNKKYKSKNLHKLLNHINHLEFNKQKDELKNEFNNWKGNNFQVDDVCIVGINL